MDAWWEGWKEEPLHDDSPSSTPLSHPPSKATIQVAWWKGWKLFYLAVICILVVLCIIIMNALILSLVSWNGLKDLSTVTFTLLYAGPIIFPSSVPDDCEILSVPPSPSSRKPKRSSGRPSASGTSGCYYSTPRCLSYTDSGLSAYPGDPLVGSQNPIRGHDPG